MSDALTDIARDEERDLLLWQICYAIKDDGKTENDKEVQELIEKVIKIRRGYYGKMLKREEVVEWIRDMMTENDDNK